MAMALPVYAEVDPLPGAPDEVELLEDGQGTASGEDTVPPEQNAATPVPDAATPEPEQSAEPEQPAPTETPEPTAEPTPTPEPTATATATPVPTVTPTATPEPTEQPQKMYAAKSVDSVQAVSEQEATDGFTVYFVVPDKINGETVSASHEIRLNVRTDATPGNSDKGEWWHSHPMEPTGRKTEDGHKIYAVKNCKDIEGKNFLEIQFQLYEGSTWKGEIKLNSNLGPISDYNNKMYDPTKGEWTDDSILTSHTYYAGKPIKFENRSTADLTSVKANFYIPDEKSETLTLVNDGSEAKPVAKEEFVTFTIPDVECSYVQFTWVEDGKNKSSNFYNFYNESVSGNDKESFMYSETRNCFIYTGADNVRWGRENSFRIYYDATFSKLPTTGTGDTSGNYSIPKANNSETIYYRIKGGNGNSEKGTLVKDDTNENLYYVDIPQEYSSNSSIIFSGEEINDDNATKGNGVSTEWLEIPTDGKNCFYADTNDDAVYKGTTRGGYWAPKGTLRDAETWKNTDTTDTTKTKVVDIESAPFTEEANTKYVTSTLYDYYTDYELNGKNRDNYKDNDNKASHRNWVTFREFDQALSDYYSNSGTTVPYPMYTGQFQPDAVGADGKEWGIRFSEIADKLNLYGYTDKKLFMAVNNSTSDRNGKGLGQNDEKLYDETFQGLAGPELKNGKPIMNGTTDLAMPFFNEEFLQGENSKKAKLGNVYKEVSFPFTQDEVFKESDATNANEKGVKYWYFDSDKTTLYLKNDPDNGGYFLQKQNALESKSKNLKSDSTPVEVKNEKGETVKNEKGEPVYTYGFFPFNSGASEDKASTYNYGFGAKLQFQFTLTSDGKVKADNGNYVPIKFFFSGDDDVWVYIDGKLALDVGGDHGKASGLLEFGADEKGNNYTSYVSDIKASNNTVYNPDANKTVTYLGNKITFKYKSKQTTTLKPGTHTLTMYYMERGMWESNMAVAFNFQDNNELQVQKQVVLKNVDPEFQKCFTDKKIFNFTIKNQATHYGTKDAAKPNPSDTKEVNLDADVSNIAPATPGSEDYIFKKEQNQWPDPEQGSGQNTEQVLHWYARYMDTQSAAREKRRGILTLNKPINIKDNMRFLTFQVYVSQEDGGELSLNNLYLELLDEKNVQKGSLGTTGINGATYGSVEVVTGKWVTVKLDLHKMKEQDNFSGSVTTIRVGDNYNRNIYFRNFTFTPKAVPSTMSGFTTDQKEIPDYKSATTGQLENAENAQYTSTKDSDTQLVDKDGRFVLEAGETVTFSDQFRRGSYISLKEDLNENLYDTTWTVCENGREVESTSPTSTDYTSVTLEKPRPLNSQSSPADGPDDGRTEKKGTDDDITGNNYTGTKPQGDTIVFRSYKNPDDTSSLTKLKVKYVNTVKTGGLKIEKRAADGENLTGTYKFKVTFNNVGGEGLETTEPIEKYVEIKMGENGDHTGTITGIPVGTRYTIEEVGEVKSADGSTVDGAKLQSVTVPDSCRSAHLIKNNTMVEGVIEKSKDPNNPELTAIFTNTKRTLINIEFDKLWKDANGKDDLSTAKRPGQIYIQLQRRLANSTNDDDWKPVNYGSTDYVTITPDDNNGWKYTFSGLDQYQINADGSQANYEYRIVEGTVENDQFEQVAPGKTITIKGNTYVVTAKATPNSEKDSAGSSTGNTATANSETNSETGATTTLAKAPDGTITGGSGKIELTNTLQNPKFVLDIIKKDAEKGKNGEDVPLGGVEFKLEKLKAETTSGGEPQVDTTYEFNDTNTGSITTGSITAKTDGTGKITNVFKNLEPGTYRLTETKAHPGYNLLAQPIKIKFTQEGKCYIDEQLIPDKELTKSSNTCTMTLTVLNRKTPELPHTGADAPSLWLLIGMPLAVAGLLIFTFRYNRKGGRRH